MTIDPLSSPAFLEAIKDHQARGTADDDRDHRGPRGQVIIPQPERASRFFSAAELANRPVPPRQWLVQDLVPHRTVTILGGDGGTGKSLLALQLATACAIGGLWAGFPVKAGNALFLSAEDEVDELHRRLDDILRAEGRDYADVAGLTLRSVAGEDALLAFDTNLALVQSALFTELDERAQLDAPDLVVIDTLADVYPANENDRAKARQFIGILRGLALRRNCAVLLLAHPSLSGLSSGSGTSGSTAWNNSVRSRLYFERVKQDDFEANTDARVLTTKKANYGPTGLEIPMTWRDGVFALDAPATGLDRMAASAKAERVFMKLLREMQATGRRVNDKGSNSYAPKVFAAHHGAEGVTQRAFAAAMTALISKGLAVIAEEGPPSRRVKYLVPKDGP
ncbi:AAA family ATPase [Tabrizicola sp. M-4]|uniref:AAA family ATPase n=1 Tax=Tabrizicola sp. M-4 TaxID=3055847 RepID=UPI003DA91D5E